MASRRQLKKDINFLCLEVVSDCYNYNYLHSGKEEKVIKIVKDIIVERNNLIARVNHTDGKRNPKLVKAYYKAIFTTLIEKVDNSFSELSNLIKQ